MIWTCQCGVEDLTTPFCGKCGHSKYGGSEKELLDYLNGHLRGALSRQEHPNDRTNQDRLGANVEKWRRWRDALEGLMKKAADA